jgi:hypothetical protein
LGTVDGNLLAMCPRGRRRQLSSFHLGNGRYGGHDDELRSATLAESNGAFHKHDNSYFCGQDVAAAPISPAGMKWATGGGHRCTFRETLAKLHRTEWRAILGFASGAIVNVITGHLLSACVFYGYWAKFRRDLRVRPAFLIDAKMLAHELPRLAAMSSAFLGSAFQHWPLQDPQILRRPAETCDCYESTITVIIQRRARHSDLNAPDLGKVDFCRRRTCAKHLKCRKRLTETHASGSCPCGTHSLRQVGVAELKKLFLHYLRTKSWLS